MQNAYYIAYHNDVNCKNYWHFQMGYEIVLSEWTWLTAKMSIKSVKFYIVYILVSGMFALLHFLTEMFKSAIIYYKIL